MIKNETSPYASFEIVLERRAVKSLEQISPEFRKQVREKINDLRQNYNLLNISHLQGFNDLFRVVCGDYRIIYQVKKSERKIMIVDIGHRREVYRILKRYVSQKL